jgi:hypothetical protein
MHTILHPEMLRLYLEYFRIINSIVYIHNVITYVLKIEDGKVYIDK